MKNIDLVFRTIGERTSDVALALAIKHIAPDTIHIIEHQKPFSQAVQHMLTKSYQGDVVVFMDADCLILEDMRPFIQRNFRPYVDCYVLDKFRGRIHCGVHITRIDVVRAMQQTQADILADDMKYILRPESRIRNIALKKLNAGEHNKAFKTFRIVHDFFQYYRDIFCKYSLRELRSRAENDTAAMLDNSMRRWSSIDLDFVVARRAVAYTRHMITPETSSSDVAHFIEALPRIAEQELQKMAIEEKSPLTMDEVMELEQSPIIHQHYHQFHPNGVKVFGIGLSRTGTKTLTKALNMLGFDVVHYPIDDHIFRELASGNYHLSMLEDFDGITDITVAPFYAQLDATYPGSKFILTTRDQESWLRSLEDHWQGKNIFDDVSGMETTLNIRRFLRASVYGSYVFNRERMSYVYDMHTKNVLDYFHNRPDSLLVLDIIGGDGWETLCPFLNKPIVDMPFPWVKSASSL